MQREGGLTETFSINLQVEVINGEGSGEECKVMAKPRTDTKLCIKADAFGLRCSEWVTTGHLMTKKIVILALAVRA